MNISGKESLYQNVETNFPDAMESLPSSSTIVSCKDVNELFKILPDKGFHYDEEEGLITCIICNQANTPNRRLRDNKVGIFSFDLQSYLTEVELDPKKQPRRFVNIKSNLFQHEKESQIHIALKEKTAQEMKDEESKQNRNEKIGLNLFRLRYNGIMHGSSYLNFEEDCLTAHLMGVDTGDINNSCDFAKDLTNNIVDVLKVKFAETFLRSLNLLVRKDQWGW